MARTIEQIIDDADIPEMEFKPSAETAIKPPRSMAVDEVPEVVLPKTKAEVYEEARSRLGTKTSAVSGKGKTPSERARAKKKRHVKTVELEIAATATTAERMESDRIKARRQRLLLPVDEPVWVGSEEELVPFAWRKPLIADLQKQSKFYKQSVREAREMRLPTLR